MPVNSAEVPSSLDVVLLWKDIQGETGGGMGMGVMVVEGEEGEGEV